MKWLIDPQKTDIIRSAFENMRSKEDLLDLLNKITSLHSGGFDPVTLENPGLLKLIEDTTPDEIFQRRMTISLKPSITQKQLDFFSTSFAGKEKRRNRYVRFYIRKKSGALREIKAPLPKLKEIQRAINTILQTIYTVQDQAYGFVPGKNIVDNARIHAGASFVLNIDIKDFFPSIHFRRIKLMLEKPPFNLTGEREPLAFLIANLCTDEGVLPQGAPTSPTFTNIICQRLDRRLQELATQYKAFYSRYADDITFSCNDYIFTRRFMERLEKILKDDRFEMNPEKTRVQGKAYRQEVTGLTVNEKANVNRQFYRSYRTMLHLFMTKGAEAALQYHWRRMPGSVFTIKSKKKIKDPDQYMRNVIWGKYYFVSMVKGETKPPPPFSIDPNKIRLGDGTFLVKNGILGLPSIKTKEEDKVIENIEVINKYFSEISVDKPEFDNKAEIGNSASGNIIERILSAWEKDHDKDGFRQAMEILKQHTNEQ